MAWNLNASKTVTHAETLSRESQLALFLNL